MSVAALYIPVSSDPIEAQRPIFEQENLLCPQNDISPLTSPINSTLINRTNIDLSLDVLSPIVALVQVQLNSLTGNGPFVSFIQVKLEPTVIITDKVVTTDKPLETKTTVELPKDEVKTKSMVTNTINTTVIGTKTTVIETNTTETNTTDLGAGSKYLVENLSFINTQFMVEITNQNNNVISGGFYEISTDPSSNHANVLQSGTFPYAPGTFTISNVLTFTPADNIRYYILVYTNYPESDNRVSKDNAIFTYSDMVS